MPINVSEAIDIDTAEQVLVERTEEGAYVEGLYVKGSVIKFKALVSVQQPTPQQLQTLKEGDRDSNPRLFISRKKLRTLSDREGTIADIVIYQGLRYKLIGLGDWASYGQTHAFGVRDQ